MDITTLPDELIAGILKYSEFTHIFRCRKVNSRINSVAKGYNLGCKVPVREFEIYNWQGDIHPHSSWKLGVQLEQNIVDFFHLRRSVSNYYDCFDFAADPRRELIILDDLLQKVENPLQFSFRRMVHPINSDFIRLFEKHRKIFRNCRKLCLSYADFVCSKEVCAKFFSLFPNLRSLCISGRNGAEIYCDTEVLNQLPLINLEIWLGLMYEPPRKNVVLEEMNDTFLMQIVKKCSVVKLWIGIYPLTKITLEGTLELIETRLLEGDMPAHFSWMLPIVFLNEMPLEAVYQRMRALPNSQCTFREEKNLEENFNSIMCEIEFPAFSGHIEFNIVTGPGDE